jgi:hypothetical protein
VEIDSLSSLAEDEDREPDAIDRIFSALRTRVPEYQSVTLTRQEIPGAPPDKRWKLGIVIDWLEAPTLEEALERAALLLEGKEQA